MLKSHSLTSLTRSNNTMEIWVEERNNGGCDKCLQDLDPNAPLHKEERCGYLSRWNYRSRYPLLVPSKIRGFEWEGIKRNQRIEAQQWRGLKEMWNLWRSQGGRRPFIWAPKSAHLEKICQVGRVWSWTRWHVGEVYMPEPVWTFVRLGICKEMTRDDRPNKESHVRTCVWLCPRWCPRPSETVSETIQRCNQGPKAIAREMGQTLEI
jgi:hypothetical protein